ncbi:MAG: single-stranded DNA-binding protein [Erysipelotrichaceae bacterium]
MNSVVMLGRVVKPIVTRKTDHGLNVVNVEVEVERNSSNSEGNYDSDIYSVTAWKDLALKCQKDLKVNDLIIIKGYLAAKSFKTKNENPFYYSEIIASSVKVINN